MKQRESLPSRDAFDRRSPWNLVSGWRPFIRGIARLATAIGGIWLLIAFACTANSEFEAQHNQLRSIHLASNCLLLGLIVWAATSDLFLRVARIEWRAWSVGRWAVFALLGVNTLLAVRNVVFCPEHAVLGHWLSQEHFADRTNPTPNDLDSSIDDFAAKCRRELPTDARILFHGPLEAAVFAYEVYPRKVFRLPSEYFRLGTLLQSRPSMKGFPLDPLEAYWHHVLPPQPDERDNFIRAHDISHEVYFEADRPAECRWEKIR